MVSALVNGVKGGRWYSLMAVKFALEPIFEATSRSTSYGFRPGRGCKDALREVAQLISGGYTYVVDADFESYFDTIPHERLMRRSRSA